MDKMKEMMEVTAAVERKRIIKFTEQNSSSLSLGEVCDGKLGHAVKAVES